MEFLPIYFIVSALITFLILYIISPKPEIILKYPSVKDKVSDMYVDDKGVCYRYHTKEINC
ncbi:hypothetical protein BMW23_0729 [Bodo saltans virus]|uniref:Uncharacterized protein n=1 Tax=Bodo saltans virus TaxID=2024608 RepID=A0A2H4UVB8_9VIRU|nr:hypothetical protein QJ851_gp0712 [Bodo saltans virus]ATZ80775.1 hypothetical protein BMW23_0729 [Bodo saltans virus]